MTPSPRPYMGSTVLHTPDFVFAGVAKCGTGFLLRVAQSHTRVRCPNKEIHFFDWHFALGWAWYSSMLPAVAKGAALVCEKSPMYFITPRAPGEITKAGAVFLKV